MAKITLSWKDDNRAVQVFNIYRSTAPMLLQAMPAPLTQVQGEFNFIEDFSVESGNTYYYRVGAVVLGREAISQEISYQITGSQDVQEFDVFWDNVISLVKNNTEDLKDSIIWSESGVIQSTTLGLEFQEEAFLYRETQALLNDNFTLEVVYTPSNNYLDLTRLLSYGSTSSINAPQIYLDNSGNLTAEITNQVILTSQTKLIKDTKYNIALIRNNQDILLFIDGVLELQSTIPDITISEVTSLYINSDEDMFASQSKQGIFHEIRITKGLARYTENYTLQDTFPENGAVKASTDLKRCYRMNPMNPRNWKPKLILNWETEEENIEYYNIYRDTKELQPLSLPERYSTANPKENLYIDRWVSNDTNYHYLVGTIKNSQESYSAPIEYYINTEFGDEYWGSVLSLLSFNSVPIICEKNSKLRYLGNRELVQSNLGRALEISENNPYGVQLLHDSNNPEKYNLLEDFTLEFFVNLKNLNDCTIIESNAINIEILDSKLVTTFDIQGVETTKELDFVTNKFVHVAIQKKLNNFRIYLNGIKKSEFILEGTLSNNINISIGASANNQNFITGLIDEFRLTTKARYNEDFAVQVSSFPPYGNFTAPINLEYLYTEGLELFEPINLTYEYK